MENKRNLFAQMKKKLNIARKRLFMYPLEKKKHIPTR